MMCRASDQDRLAAIAEEDERELPSFPSLPLENAKSADDPEDSLFRYMAAVTRLYDAMMRGF